MSEAIVDVTMENAQANIIDESLKRPVLVDFWASWCEPCKNLMPVLEKLAEEFKGQFLLAKVNADDQQMLAAQFGVRSLPTVMLIKDGQPLDGFTGAKPEAEIREMLEKVLPKVWEGQLYEAKNLMAQQQYNEAYPLLREANEGSQQHASVLISLAECLAGLKRYDEAEEQLSLVKLVDQDQLFEQVKASITLAQEAQKTPELQSLEAEREQNPEDLSLAFQLAVQYSQNDFKKEALELLFTILKKDMNFNDGEVKKSFMDILALLGKGDPIAAEYQRKLYTLLY